MNRVQHVPVIAVLLAAVLTTALPAAAAAPETTEVTICDPFTLFLRKADDGAWDASPGERFTVRVYAARKYPQVWLITDDPGEVLAACNATRIDSNYLLRCRLDDELPKGQDLVALVLPPAAAGMDSSKGDREPVAIGTFSTKPAAVVKPSGADKEAAYAIEVVSRTPLASVPDQQWVTEVVQAAGLRPTLGDSPETTPEVVRRHLAYRWRPDTSDCSHPGPAGPQPPTCDLPDSALLGYWLCLPQGEALSRRSAALRIEGLRDVFGQTFTAKGEIAAKKPPEKKDTADLFLRGLFEGGEDAADSWIVDLKAKPQALTLGSGWLYWPELSASVAHKVSKATDSIRLASLFAKGIDAGDAGLFSGHDFFLGPTLEADRDLDRVNAVADLRWQPELRGMYQSQEVQRKRLLLDHDPKAKVVHPPTWGYGLEALLGVEAGSSIREQTVEGSGGNPDLAIPSYDIARLRVQVEGFVEYRRLTLSVISGLRYLTTEELVSRKSAEGVLSLREIDGARDYSEASLTVDLDRTGHVAFAATYKKGSLPPVFTRVDTYSLGLAVKY